MSTATSRELFSVQSVRKDFPFLERRWERSETIETKGSPGKQWLPLAYLDNAATSQKPRPVIEAVKLYYERSNANVHRGLYELSEEATRAYETARKVVQRFIGARRSHEIVFTRSTTESINLVASSWGKKHIGAGDRILLTEMEHHSNLVPWQLLSQERGAQLTFIPINPEDGTLELSGLEHLLSDNVRLVALTQMSNVLGTVNPTALIIEAAHSRGIPVLIDGAQGVPHQGIDVEELDCDFLAFSGHKMCGPTGIGVLYGKEKWLEEMEPYQTGGEMIQAAWFDRAIWKELPYKFEAGTPHIAGAVGLKAAVDYLQNLSMEKLWRYERKLTEHALRSLDGMENLILYGRSPDRGGIFSFNIAGVHAHDVAQFLDGLGVAVRAGHHCAHPLIRKLGVVATCRASLYFYNTAEEIDRLVAGLTRAEDFFVHGVS
jgi:cysteine desulfurase/selenocysteine lyase